MLIIGNSPKGFPFRSKTIHERLNLTWPTGLFVPCWAFRGRLALLVRGSALSAIAMAIVIIPNLAEMFNENRTFLKYFENEQMHA